MGERSEALNAIRVETGRTQTPLRQKAPNKQKDSVLV